MLTSKYDQVLDFQHQITFCISAGFVSDLKLKLCLNILNI